MMRLIDSMVCPVIGLISWGVQPASDKRVTAVPRRSLNVRSVMPALIFISLNREPRSFALSQGRRLLRVKMMGLTRGKLWRSVLTRRVTGIATARPWGHLLAMLLDGVHRIHPKGD